MTASEDELEILRELSRVIADRKRNVSEQSYTATLFAKGLEKIGAKLLEEACETVVAAHRASGPNDPRMVSEAADLVYHLLVLLAEKEVPLASVSGELRRRFGVSGLAEKASRGR